MTEGNGEIRGRLVRPPAADQVGPAPSLFIATPAFGGQVTVQYAHGIAHLTRTLDRSGIQHTLHLMYGESLITRARNRMVATFLKSSFSHLFFIDADIGFRAHDCKYVLEACNELGGVVCGAYPRKGYGWKNIADAAQRGVKPEALDVEGAMYVVNATPHGSTGQEITGRQINGAKYLEVQDVATGFMCVKREVFETIIARFKRELEYVADYPPDMGETHYKIFHADTDPSSWRQAAKLLAVEQLLDKGAVDEALLGKLREAYDSPEGGRYLSEDHYFSRLWQLCGGKVWLCLDCKLSHTGANTWVGNVSRLFEQHGDTIPAPAMEAAAAAQ